MVTARQKSKTPLDHSPHPSQRYMPGLGQMWVFTKKGMVVKVLGRELTASAAAVARGCEGGEGDAETGKAKEVRHQPKALF
jgi:hypothetical protein